MLTLLVIVLCPLLPSFTASSPGVAAPTEVSPVQRLYGEAAAGGSNLHRYLDIVEKTCLSEGRSMAVCLSCETLATAAAAATGDHGVNAFVCCKWEAVYAHCRPFVEGPGPVDRRLPKRSERSGYLGKRYRNRFLGKRSELEDVFQNDDQDGYKELEKDLSLYLQRRGKATSSVGGRRPNNFLGKRRNTFLGKRYGNADREVRWDLEDNGRGKGNFEEIPGDEAWKK